MQLSMQHSGPVVGVVRGFWRWLGWEICPTEVPSRFPHAPQWKGRAPSAGSKGARGVHRASHKGHGVNRVDRAAHGLRGP